MSKEKNNVMLTEEQFHNQLVKDLLNLTTALSLKQTIAALFSKSLDSEMAIDFAESISPEYYDYKLLHDFLVKLHFYHEKEITPQQFLLE